ncbi:MAG: tetratricopeptide repeat protein [Planctomycetes bacterium]|nr:tetratricopeptide repeat protein [Planctomycetota bacterium]
MRGRLDEALRHYERASALRPDDNQPPLLMAQVHDDLGRPADAAEARRVGVARVERRCRLSPDDARALYMGANGLVALGETERGLQWARPARELDPEEPMLLYNLACIFSLAGRPDDAVQCLDEAVRHGFANAHYIDHDSNLDAVREDPRFVQLAARLRVAP